MERDFTYDFDNTSEVIDDLSEASLLRRMDAEDENEPYYEDEEIFDELD